MAGVAATYTVYFDSKDHVTAGDPAGAIVGPESYFTETDISTYVQSIAIRRGRDDWLQDFQPGTATLELTNSDNRFSPDYASSPYYPFFTVGRAVIVKANYSAVNYYIFFGYIESIVPHPMASQQSCTVNCIDALARMSLIKNQAFLHSSALSGTIFSDLLAGTGVTQPSGSPVVNWPAAMTTYDLGQSTFAVSYNQVTNLAILQDIARNESGFCFAGANGFLLYRDRLSRITGSASSTSQATFNNAMIDLQSEMAARDVYNEIDLTTAAGNILPHPFDAVSWNMYGRRTLSLQTQWISQAEGTDHANFVLGFRKDPHTRARMVVVNDDATNLVAQLSLELNSRITVIQSPVINGDFFVEAIEHLINAGGQMHRTTYQLSPANASAYWQLGVTNYTEVGSTSGVQPTGATRPGY